MNASTTWVPFSDPLYLKYWGELVSAAGIVLSTTFGEVEPLLHDLRRSGAKGMVDRGVNRHVAMKIGGWRTEAMLRRYHIIDKTELLDATAQLDAEQRQDAESPPPRKHSSAYSNRRLTTV